MRTIALPKKEILITNHLQSFMRVNDCTPKKMKIKTQITCNRSYVRTIALPKKYKNKNTNHLQLFVRVNDCTPKKIKIKTQITCNRSYVRTIALPKEIIKSVATRTTMTTSGISLTLSPWTITLTVYASVPIPTNSTIPHLSPNHHQIILLMMTFLSPVSSPSSKGPISTHLPTPSCSILLDNFPNPRPTLDMLSDTGPVDQYDASLWQPDCTPSIPVRARDGEFEHFILDEQGRLRNPDPTSCLALLQQLKCDTNCVK